MTEIDVSILDLIQNNLRCAFLDIIMPMISALMNGGALAIIVTISLMISKKYRRVGFAMALALLMCLLFGNLLIKNLAARPRPFTHMPDISLLIPPPRDYSFPSGHSFASFASATVLAKRIKKTAPYVIALAVLVAFSRLYLYVHFPSDVLCGSALGIAAGLISCRIVGEKNNREESMNDEKGV